MLNENPSPPKPGARGGCWCDHSRDEEGQGVPKLTLGTLTMKTLSKIFETEVLLLHYETREKQNWEGCGGWGGTPMPQD